MKKLINNMLPKSEKNAHMMVVL